MLLAEKMDRASFLILQEDTDAVLEEIAKAGLLHPTRIEDLDAWANDLTPYDTTGLAVEYTKRRQRIERLFGDSPPNRQEIRPSSPREIHLDTPEAIDAAIARIESALAPSMSVRDEIGRKRDEYRAVLTKTEPVLATGLPMGQLAHSAFLTSAVGIVDERHLPKLERLLASVPSFLVPYGREKTDVRVTCITLRKDRAVLEKALKEVGFKEFAQPDEIKKAFAGDETALREEVRRLDEQFAAAEAEVQRARQSLLPEIASLLDKTEAALLVLRIRDMCRLTGRSCVFAGWSPRSRTHELVEAIESRTSGRAIIEVVPAEAIESVAAGEVEVPVLLQHPWYLEPFGMLVKSFGTPSYRTIDPTAFVSITFLPMFGMMFGDLGHGAVLVALGLFMVWHALRGKTRGCSPLSGHSTLPILASIGVLMTFCGISACIFGILFGSVFGIETLLPTIWVKPLESIETLFAVAVGFGIVVLTLGVVLNTVNAIRTRSFVKHFFESSGPLGGVIYWLGVILALGAVSGFIDAAYLKTGVSVFVILLFSLLLKGPVLKLLKRQENAFPHGVVSYFMEGFVEIAEFLMGYLANTVSFIRVAAFGLAHAGLFVAVFGLSEIVSEVPAGGAMSILVIIFGNVFILVLEGAVVTIQILRLEYYEFFGKFFREFGVKYEPVCCSDTFAGSTR